MNEIFNQLNNNGICVLAFLIFVGLSIMILSMGYAILSKIIIELKDKIKHLND